MKKFRQFLKSSIIKYLIVFVVFLFAMFTSSEHNWQMRLKNKETIKELKQEINHYKAKTEDSKRRLQELSSEKEDLEKFARERYRMHAPNEDVYVVEYE